ncbi:MAG: hypothetical protein WCE30_24035 [Mycobacterium sp.]
MTAVWSVIGAGSLIFVVMESAAHFSRVNNWLGRLVAAHEPQPHAIADKTAS